MSLSEKAAQLDGLAEEAKQAISVQAVVEACQAYGERAAAIIGDLPASRAAMDTWRVAQEQANNTFQAVNVAVEKLHEIANAVRQAGSA